MSGFGSKNTTGVGIITNNYPDIEGFTFRSISNFNVPYILGTLKRLEYSEDVACFTPGNIMVGKASSAYSHSESKSNFMHIQAFGKFSSHEINKISLDGLEQILKANLALEYSDQRKQVFVRRLGEDEFEYYIVDGISSQSSSDLSGHVSAESSSRVIGIFNESE